MEKINNIPKGGIFNITIKDGVIIKELKNVEDMKYKYNHYNITKNSILFANIIMNIHKDPLIGIFVEPALSVVNTTYSMRYISNSICLNNIEEIKKLSDEIKKDIKKQIINIFNILKNNYPNITGDWKPSNLIYDKDQKKVLNIDLEGFFSINFTKNDFYEKGDNIKNIWIIKPEKDILSYLE